MSSYHNYNKHQNIKNSFNEIIAPLLLTNKCSFNMKQVNIYEAKTQLSKLIEAAAAGEEVIIARAGRPVARLSGLDKPVGKRKLGVLDGQFSIPEDFNAPLPDEVLESFYGKR